MRVAFYFICIFFHITSTPISQAQSSTIDSIERQLSNHSIRDSVRVDLLNSAAEAFQNINPQNAFKHLKEAGEIVEEINYPKGKADYYDQMAMYYYVISEFCKVQEYSNKSLLINQSINNQKGLAKNYYYIGKIQYFQGEVDKATKFIKQALRINIALKDSASICYNYASLGTNYADIGNYDLALQYAELALEIATKINDEEAMSFTLNNLGVVYEHHGNWPKALECYQKSFLIDERQNNYKDASIAASNIAHIYIVESNYSDALKYCLKGLGYAEEIGFKTGLCYNYEYMGRIYTKKGAYDKAWEYQNKTLKLQQEIGNKQGELNALRDLANILVLTDKLVDAMELYNKAVNLSQTISYKRTEISSYIGISTIYDKQNKHTEAYLYSKKAYLMATELDDIQLISESAKMLAKTSERLGLYKEALGAHIAFKTMSDSLFNKENIRRISNLEYEYKSAKEKAIAKREQDKKDRLQEAELKKQKAFRNTFIVGFLFMLLLVVSIWRSSIEKKKTNRQLRAKNLEINKQKEELINTNKSLEQLSQFKEDMTNMVIHDLKNPLSTLVNIDILSELDEKDELIKHLSLRMLSMIENTLDVYRNESIDLMLHKEYKDIHGIVNGAIEEVGFLARMNELSFDVQVENKIEVNSDAMVLRRVFSNILSNAVKFSSPSETVTIKATISNSDLLKVSVHNIGSFISEEQQKHIFNRFAQVKAHAKTKMHSTGIGLTYCTMAIESHGGQIGVNSSQEAGTTFWFTLPEAKSII
ncbi:tetratricopeptide repeat-containing sensor histidine kinase [Carboxylicivirga sp. N1Y90]|uniref:tetratricopeptide repeat-containing sensor histidine kinase n=1 Tax=Carboxylicivirga fragile TaxID=3417571 RepID=UPI003D34B395|nr:tetratricopeptide repeat-containing sensor histidine kinase [Marinilabiliaceae bacterium N1Y90]